MSTRDLFATSDAAPSPVAASTIRAAVDCERRVLAALSLFGAPASTHPQEAPAA